MAFTPPLQTPYRQTPYQQTPYQQTQHQRSQYPTGVCSLLARATKRRERLADQTTGHGQPVTPSHFGHAPSQSKRPEYEIDDRQMRREVRIRRVPIVQVVPVMGLRVTRMSLR